MPTPPLVDEATQTAVKLQLARTKVLSSRNLHYSYLLRTLVVCGQCGLRMSCFRRTQSNGRGDYHYYGCSRGPEDSGHAARCKAQYLRAAALDATVWSAVCQWLREPRILMEEIASWQERREGEEASARERIRLESTCKSLERQVERLVDAYQQGALRVDELKVRRAQLETALEAARARAKELQAQHADEERLGEQETQLEAFAAAVREGLDALDFKGRQQLVRLLIERVVVTGEHATIEHAIPLSGRFCRLRKNDAGRVRLPQVWGQAASAVVPDGPPVRYAPFWSTWACPCGLLSGLRRRDHRSWRGVEPQAAGAHRPSPSAIPSCEDSLGGVCPKGAAPPLHRLGALPNSHPSAAPPRPLCSSPLPQPASYSPYAPNSATAANALTQVWAY